MRPVVVLILILGAVSALVFAIASLSLDSRSAQAVTRPVVQQAEGDVRSPAVLDQPDQFVDPAEPIEPVEREVLAEAPEGNWKNEIRGIVRTREGVVVENAAISLLRYSEVTELAELAVAMDGAAPPKAYKRAASDEAGRFRFRSLDPEVDWALVVHHDEYSSEEAGPIDLHDEGIVEEIIELRAGFQLFGIVTDAASGAAIANAELLLDDPMSQLLPRKRKNAMRKEVESDQTGAYLFQNVSPGSRSLTCYAKGYATQVHSGLRFMGNDDLRIEQNCAMKPGMVIAGKVMAPDGRGIAGAELMAISHQSENASSGTTRTAAGGEFLIEDVGEGLYTLRVTVEGWDIDPVPRIEAGDTNVEIRATEQGGVMGTVVDKKTGDSLSDFKVTVRSVHPSNNAYGRVAGRTHARGSDDGTFQVGGISPGRYLIQADATGYASTFSEPFYVRAGETTPDVRVLISRGATLKGFVLDGTTGEPVVGAVVKTQENNWIDNEFGLLLGGMGDTAMTVVKVKTDEQGEFEIKTVHPAEYQVRISHPRYTELIKNDVMLRDNEETNLGSLVLTKGATLRGTVYGPGGREANGLDVYLNATDGRMYGANRQARTDANGRYLIRNVASGSYRLSAARPPNKQSGGPFGQIVDMKNSETEIAVFDGQEYDQDLYLGKD